MGGGSLPQADVRRHHLLRPRRRSGLHRGASGPGVCLADERSGSRQVPRMTLTQGGPTGQPRSTPSTAGSFVSTIEMRQGRPVLDVVVPVHNEEVALPAAIEQLTAHLVTMPWSWRITIADNASTDATSAVAHALTEIHSDVQLVHLPVKGRGRALKQVWLHSDADVLVYMDVDLSTDLNALMPLVAP